LSTTGMVGVAYDLSFRRRGHLFSVRHVEQEMFSHPELLISSLILSSCFFELPCILDNWMF